MPGHYCVYFGNKPFYITDHLDPTLYALSSRGGTILINQPTVSCLPRCIHDLEHTEARAAIVLTHHTGYFWNEFCNHFQYIMAAGGLVVNPAGAFLFIFRRGAWDLPKGKLDEGEDIRTCALREITEETGLQDIQITGELGSTWHTYHERGAFVLKETQWFRMAHGGGEALVPQAEEDITDIRWISQSELDQVMRNTFPSIEEVIRRNSNPG
ncbi:MAG: NUDIX domain-containing protein [Chitinophagaceae bacterium]|nr:NUDIX domain-containing protein [Chitinophagaceae bacterium]